MRRLAAFLFAGTLLAWLALGANTGWTKTSREVRTLDEVTGLEGITYERKFSPGLELVGLAGAVAGGLAVLSLFLRGGRRMPEAPLPQTIHVP